MSTTPAAGSGDSATARRPDVDVAALYTRYHERLHRHARSTLPRYRHTDAAAAVMAVFVRLLEKARDGSLPEPHKGWEPYLVRAVTNACRDILRTKQHDEFDGAEWQLQRQAAERSARESRSAELEEALEALNPRLRAIVVAKHYDGKTNRAIGAELGLTGQRVGQLYKEALQQLREELTRNG